MYAPRVSKITFSINVRYTRNRTFFFFFCFVKNACLYRVYWISGNDPSSLFFFELLEGNDEVEKIKSDYSISASACVTTDGTHSIFILGGDASSFLIYNTQASKWSIGPSFSGGKTSVLNNSQLFERKKTRKNWIKFKEKCPKKLFELKTLAYETIRYVRCFSRYE